MPVSVGVLFETPQKEIASRIRDRLNRCVSASIVSGFLTVEGVEAIAAPLRANPNKLSLLVVGAGTYRAYDALDRLIGAGVPRGRLFVHLGHSRPTVKGARHSFYRYHPMLHSKIYLMEMGDGTACAFVGSHNITGFAPMGLNGEAAVLIEGPADSEQFEAIRKHIEASRKQAVAYASGMKEAFSWWMTQFIEGLRDKSNDAPRDGEGKKTIVVLTANGDDPLPVSGDIIYFEIPAALGKITSLNAEVHIYVFTVRPPTPYAGLDNLGNARSSLWCFTQGLELEQGGAELKADWFVDNKIDPQLIRAPRPFRPSPSPGMQQVRVEVRNNVYGRFEYLFDTEKPTWEPEFDHDTKIQVSTHDVETLQGLKLIPQEDQEWFLVKGLKGDDQEATPYEKALAESSPDSGSYVLISLRRRNRDQGSKGHRR